MFIYPAIDLYEGKAVRLFKGRYEEMTVYSEHPEEIALNFLSEGATRLHLVDLEGARDGTTPNLDVISRIISASGLFTEVGGGIRSMDIAERYIDAGVSRVILGTAAVTNPEFLEKAIARFGEKIAVGADIADGKIAIKGWKEKSNEDALNFCRRMEETGVKTLISTDISRDGAMRGANHALYRTLSEELTLDVIASGGVSTMEDVVTLRNLGIHGAIIGKAYYTGSIKLGEAIEEARK